MTLLQETLYLLDNFGKTTDGVMWIGSSDGQWVISWDQFEEIANIKYDSGFGAQEIASDLVIVGKDWWAERYEYDGSEHWDFKQMPTLSDEPKPFKNIHVSSIKAVGWRTIDEMNADVPARLAEHQEYIKWRKENGLYIDE